MRSIFCTVLAILIAGSEQVDSRIDLAEFGRAVEYTGNTPETLQARTLERSLDGWEVWKGPDGQAMIGLEFDEPRDLAEVGVEFRHAIARRNLIHVQYFKQHWPDAKKGGWAPVDDPFHGEWVTAKAQWWAGDRDVNFGFLPYNQEQPGPKAPDYTYRRTYRVRFLLGNRELPPVRFLHAYGPRPYADGDFDLQFDARSAVHLPLDLSVVNGFFLEGKYAEPSLEMPLDYPPASLTVRYAQGDMQTPTRTVVTLRNAGKRDRGVSFLPDEAASYGSIRVPSLGVTIVHRGGAVGSQPTGSQPATQVSEMMGDGAGSGEAAATPPKPPLRKGGKEGPAGAQVPEGGRDARLPQGAIYDRVATQPAQTFERARREIPELDIRKPGRYVPLGPPSARQELAVYFDGSILVDKSALKVPADDSKRMNWPANRSFVRLRVGEPAVDLRAAGKVHQARMDGYLPIAVSTWEDGGISYEESCVATYVDGEPARPRGDETVALLARLKMTNTGGEARDAVVRLAVEPAEQLILDGDDVLAAGLIKGGKIQAYPRPYYRIRVSGPGQTDRSVEGKSTVLCRERIEPGQARMLAWAVPFVDLNAKERERVGPRLAGFDGVVAAEADRWRKIVGQAAAFEVPDPLLSDFYKSSLVDLLITADQDPFKPMSVLPAGTFGYGVCLNESCIQVLSLELRGLHADAQRYLDSMLLGQSTRGLQGRFTDKRGVLNGMPTETGQYQTFNYNLDHGFTLWVLNEHYRYTRDREWLARVAPALVEACDFVTRQCNAPPESNLLGRSDQLWGVGLLPPGHLEDPPEWLWWFAVNAYAWRGMAATAESLKEIGHPQAARIARDAAAFGATLRRSCRESMIRAPVVRLRDGTYVPFQPTRSRLRGRDAGWIRDALYGPIQLIDCGVWPADSQEAEWILRDAEDNVFIGPERGYALSDFERQWFSWGGMTLQPNLLPVPLAYLARGMPKHALRGFYNALCASVYADVRCFAEWVPEPGTAGGPLFKPPDESAFVVWLRHLLIAERGNDLDLLGGVPVEWLSPGKMISIRSAATWFGPMDLHAQLEAGGKRLAVDLAGPRRNPPQRVRIHAGAFGRIATVTLDGKAIASFDPKTGVIELPGEAARGKLVISY